MLDEGYTLDGAAQALGWSRQLVTARAKILKLPEAGQAARRQRRDPGQRDRHAACDRRRLTADRRRGRRVDRVPAPSPGRSSSTTPAGRSARRCATPGRTPSAAYLNTIHHRDLKALRLGKKTEALVADAEKLHKQVDQYAYGPPSFRFDASDIDQARAAGVLIELDRSAPIITDLAAVPRARQAGDRADRRAAARAGGGQGRRASEPAPRSGSARRARSSTSSIARPSASSPRQAHGTNLDLGAALLTELATVAPDDMDVARFFALCGRPHRAN